MAYLTREQVKEIISKAPAGTSPEGIVSALRLQGNQIEGLNTAPPVDTTQKSNSFMDNVKGFAVGLGSSIIGTAKGVGDLVGLKPTPFGERLLKSTEKTSAGTIGKPVGKFAGDVAQIALPVGEVGALTKGLPKIAQVASKAATSAGVVTAQEGKLGVGTVLAGATEGLAPVVGMALRPVTRLVKSLASGLSGVSSKTIDAMVSEGNLSKEIAQKVDSEGATNIIKKNAETIISGVSKIRQDARKAYGQAIEALKSTDINPQVFRDSISQTLDNIGSEIKNGVRKLTNAEFDNPVLVKKANTFIDQLSKVELNGYSLNKLQNNIESAAFKTTGGDAQRLSFNAFLHDLSGSIRNAINQSTDKLSEINKAYSTDLQLTDAIENIFGDVKFKNLEEVLKVSKRLEGLFTQKGIAPQIVDDFLNKIGVKPSEFRASEAIRQISDVGEKANAMGLNVSEVMRGLTSSIITPKAVRDASILTGITTENLTPILEKLSPTARAGFIRMLIDEKNK